MVKDCFENQDHNEVWCPQFRKELEDWMVGNWMEIMYMLKGVYAIGSTNDCRIWEVDIHGS